MKSSLLRTSAVLASVLLLLLSGCAVLIQPSAAHVSWAEERRPGTTLQELQDARAVFLDTCTRCHLARSPTLYEPDRWDFAIRRMLAGESVTISDEVIETVVLYLSVASALPTRRAVAGFEAAHGEAASAP